MNAPIDIRKNGLDCVRYYASISVMILHFTAFYLYYGSAAHGISASIATLCRNLVCAIPGVVILFSLSGFLAQLSLERDARLLPYIKKRLIRIYPELWIVTGFTVIVLLLLVRNRLDKSFLLWIGTQLIGIANTPACLKDWATGSVNGALWTIFVQLQFYVIWAVLFPLFRRMKAVLWGIGILLCVCMNVICQYLTTGLLAGGAVSKLIERSFVPYLLWFALGAAICRYREKILPILKRFGWTGIIALLLIQAGLIPDYGYYAGILTGLIAPCAALGIGYALPARRLPDYSYEMFLTHWIWLNVLMHFGLIEQLGLWSFVLFFVLTVLSAVTVKKVDVLLSKNL